MNKYTKWYENLIQTRKDRTLTDVYFEKHHIIPRSLGGKDSNDNLIQLTAREHFIAHLLLAKMYSGEAGMKMSHALRRMLTGHKDNRYIPNSHIYALVRSIAMKNCSGENNPMFGRTGEQHPSYGRKEEIYNDEFRAKISETSKGRTPWNKGKKIGPQSTESIAKRSAATKGVAKSDSHKRKIGDAQRGVPKSDKSVALITGDNHYSKQPGFVSKKKGRKEEQITCPHCGKAGGANAMKRYHFDNCKNLK